MNMSAVVMMHNGLNGPITAERQGPFKPIGVHALRQMPAEMLCRSSIEMPGNLRAVLWRQHFLTTRQQN